MFYFLGLICTWAAVAVLEGIFAFYQLAFQIRRGNVDSFIEVFFFYLCPKTRSRDRQVHFTTHEGTIFVVCGGLSHFYTGFYGRIRGEIVQCPQFISDVGLNSVCQVHVQPFERNDVHTDQWLTTKSKILDFLLKLNTPEVTDAGFGKGDELNDLVCSRRATVHDKVPVGGADFCVADALAF